LWFDFKMVYPILAGLTHATDLQLWFDFKMVYPILPK